jgi:hypothetical protein
VYAIPRSTAPRHAAPDLLDQPVIQRHQLRKIEPAGCPKRSGRRPISLGRHQAGPALPSWAGPEMAMTTITLTRDK